MLCFKEVNYQLIRSKRSFLLIFFFLKFCCASLEERQRAEKRIREASTHQFKPRWFDLTEEVTPTPWGELEIYQYNGKYTQHRTAIDSSDVIDEVDIRSIEFNPWQYSNLSTE